MELTKEKIDSYWRFVKGAKELAEVYKDDSSVGANHKQTDWVIDYCENNDMCAEFIDCGFNQVALYALCKIRLKEARGEIVDYEKIKMVWKERYR